MREQEPQTVIVFTSDFYYGNGEELQDAIAAAYKAGARRTQEVSINIYTGPRKWLDRITIDGGGGVGYHPEHVTSNLVGRVKMPMKQPQSK